MTRAALALMAGLLCAFAGFRHAAQLKATAARLSRWVQLLEHLSLLLQQGTLSIPELLCTTACSQQPPDLLLHQAADLIRNDPLLSPAEAFRRCALEGPECDVLSRFFQRLGHGTKESRSLAAAQAAQELQLLQAQASAAAEKDVKLWQTLGFTGGICLTILLL